LWVLGIFHHPMKGRFEVLRGAQGPERDLSRSNRAQEEGNGVVQTELVNPDRSQQRKLQRGRY
jgi:hypothetical protein